MININDFKDFVYMLANKSGKGTITPAQFNLAVKAGLDEWTFNRIGNVKEYQPGRPIPRVAYEMTQHITDDLRHLKEVRDVEIDTSGQISIPDGSTITDVNGSVMPKFLHWSSLRAYYKIKQSDDTWKTTENSVKLYPDEQIDKVLDSEIIPPTTSYPVGTMWSDKVQVWPVSGLQRLRLTYLRQPTTPSWAYTTVNSRPVYDSANSVDIDAPDDAQNELAMNVLGFLGIHLRDQNLMQYSNLNKQQGM
jgi:hypothetical protein